MNHFVLYKGWLLHALSGKERVAGRRKAIGALGQIMKLKRRAAVQKGR